jgi:hypothetical protein
MLVLDANILVRGVLGHRVRQLVETYAAQGVRFYAPAVAFDEAEKYLPPLLEKRGKSAADLPASLNYLRNIIEPVDQDLYGPFEDEARLRLRGRDENDWPLLVRRSHWLVPCGRKTRTFSEQASRCGQQIALKFSCAHKQCQHDLSRNDRVAGQAASSNYADLLLNRGLPGLSGRCQFRNTPPSRARILAYCRKDAIESPSSGVARMRRCARVAGQLIELPVLRNCKLGFEAPWFR